MAAELDLFPSVGLAPALATTIGVAAGLYFALLMFAVVVAVISALQDAHARLSTTLGDLERLVDSKDEFVASISHELRTPLTAVVGFSNELDTSWTEFDESLRREMVGAIARQGRDLAHIIEDLLVAARADTGTLSVLSQPMDVVAVTLEVASERGTRVEYGGGSVMAMADPLRFRQIVRNMVTNAHRYGGPTDGSRSRLTTPGQPFVCATTAPASRRLPSSGSSSPTRPPTRRWDCPVRSAWD
jgi:signal transduction histidine kinase